MVLERIFGIGSREEVEEYVELDFDEEKNDGTVYIVVEKLDSSSDVDRVKRLLREGFIVFVSIKAMKERDMSELKRAISSLRKTCAAINGDIVGVSDEWVIVTPSFARVYREEEGEE